MLEQFEITQDNHDRLLLNWGPVDACLHVHDDMLQCTALIQLTDEELTRLTGHLLVQLSRHTGVFPNADVFQVPGLDQAIREAAEALPGMIETARDRFWRKIDTVLRVAGQEPATNGEIEWVRREFAGMPLAAASAIVKRRIGG